MPYPQIAGILAACAAANWAIFDKTLQGLLLAALCGMSAPASELLLMKVFHVWHYAKPGGIPLQLRPPRIHNDERALARTRHLPSWRLRYALSSSVCARMSALCPLRKSA